MTTEELTVLAALCESQRLPGTRCADRSPRGVKRLDLIRHLDIPKPDTSKADGNRPTAPAVGPFMRTQMVAVLLALLIAPRPGQCQTRPLTLTYLANMGVHLERDGLERARPPFTAIDLALTTHRHLDHFDAASVAARLQPDPTAWYLAARETVDSLVARSGISARHPRVIAATPPPGTGGDYTIHGISVRVLDLPLNRTPSRRVANVGFLVTVGGATVLHVGDADPTVANFAPHRLPARGIDVAILPFWYFSGRDHAAVLDAIGARHYIASHVPLADTASVRQQLKGSARQVTLLATPGTRIEIPINHR